MNIFYCKEIIEDYYNKPIGFTINGKIVLSGNLFSEIGKTTSVKPKFIIVPSKTYSTNWNRSGTSTSVKPNWNFN